MWRTLLLCGIFGTAAMACGDGSRPVTEDDDLAKSSTDYWVYSGPLPTLDDARVFVSIAGHTVRVTGLLPAGMQLDRTPPHVRLESEGSRTRVHAVYPAATARAGKKNAAPGNYALYDVMPYRPDGIAVTLEEGEHMVPWGGFPFLRYNGGIAMHGPITDADNKVSPDFAVWTLRRGDVSAGCNRMLGEHVVEVAHLTGVNMRKMYKANQMVNPPRRVPVTVLKEFDAFRGAPVDVDYPTDGNTKRPPLQSSVMFGSWIASTMDGRDVPGDAKWEGGVAGKPYVFAEHITKNWVCSIPAKDLPAVRAWLNGRELRTDFCAVRTCYLDAIRRKTDPAACTTP